jgi:hypothetical protein
MLFIIILLVVISICNPTYAKGNKKVIVCTVNGKSLDSAR